MHAKKTNKTKVLAVVLALVLVIGCAAGATLAWLMDSTQEVKNTFTYGDINIELEETDADEDGNANANEYKMIPGNTITKDPKVTVVKGSEDCWLFVKIEKSTNFDTFMDYTMADGWKALPDVNGVYYRDDVGSLVDATDDAEYAVLKDNTVTVKDEVTKEMLNSLTEATYPTLTFTAYAIQRDDNIDTAADAWAKITTPANP